MVADGLPHPIRSLSIYEQDPTLTDFLEAKRQEIHERLEELRPTVEEYQRLEAAERALSGVGADNGRSGSRSSGGGRRRENGTRAQQALELVKNRPGITIPELAEAMDIKQNYLYRVMPDLAEQGVVVKSGRGWHIKAA
jgi:sugar-specific transcriptional regulator TrmB